MKDIKLFIIQCIDWFDDNILCHRWHKFCCIISDNSWWGERQEEVKLSNQSVLDPICERCFNEGQVVMQISDSGTSRYITCPKCNGESAKE